MDRIRFVTFYANYLPEKPPVRLVEVHDSVPKTTGLVEITDNGVKISLWGERNVRRPRPGYRYHEYRIR